MPSPPRMLAFSSFSTTTPSSPPPSSPRFLRSRPPTSLERAFSLGSGQFPSLSLSCFAQALFITSDRTRTPACFSAHLLFADVPFCLPCPTIHDRFTQGNPLRAESAYSLSATHLQTVAERKVLLPNPRSRLVTPAPCHRHPLRFPLRSSSITTGTTVQATIRPSLHP